MDPFHFACPHCSSPLRVREKLLIDRQLDCPECGKSLVIIERAGELAVEPAAQPTRTSLASRPDGPARPVEPRLHKTFLRRPSWTITMGIAGMLTVVSIAFLMRSPAADLTEQPDQAAADAFNPAGPDDTDRAPADAREMAFANRGDDANDRIESAGPPVSIDDDELLEVGENPAREADAGRSPAHVGAPDTADRDDDLPIDPEFAPEPVILRKIDLTRSLKQPIARFDQPRSTPLEEVLVSVAEMAGARILYDRDELGPAAARLAEPFALKQEDTTVGEILTLLLRPAGLAYEIEDDHLRLVRAE